MPLVSVVIPTYNCERFIEQTLRGVLGQTIKDLEVIVVDDGSTDKTTTIVKGYSQQVKLIEQENSGVCRARNHGIEKASAAFVCVLDHDDFWAPKKLEMQLTALAKHPDVDVVFSSFLLWHPAAGGTYPEPESLFPAQPSLKFDPEFSGWIYHQFLLDCWMLTRTALFRREVVDSVGLFDESLPYSEDWDLWLRISRRHQFLKLRYPTTLYRQHPTQGNRVVRDIDFRTRLLEKAYEKWGLLSPDGRSISNSIFGQYLKKYHIEFGLSHLGVGNRLKGIRSLYKAWQRSPFDRRVIALLAASCVGWAPKKRKANNS